MTERTSKLIDGNEMAGRLRARIARQVASLQSGQGLTPGLTVILVGENPASQVYVRNKEKQAREAGMASTVHRLPTATTEAELLELVRTLNGDPTVHGILVQLPLPSHIGEASIVESVHPDKDVDGFHPINAGRLATGGEGNVPCTPLGCLMLIKDRLADLSGQKALVIGRSNIVGKPMALLLLREHCTVEIAHSRTRDLAGECRQADIVVAAVGRPRMVKGDWIKPGALVIDVGINRIDAGEGKTRLVGDVDFDAAIERAGAITPVPGGVGPMTIACLLQNTLVAACRQRGVAIPAPG
jgi:methylenetetrahydrofolate dehydrogenase (NADP+)/methenyltetrahydrofolate cyclohydrolase